MVGDRGSSERAGELMGELMLMGGITFVSW